MPANDFFAPPTPSPVVPVSLFVSSARLLIERQLGLAWISGEISGFTRASSGHCYFMLKDDKAQVRCVLFRQKARLLEAILADGAAVEVRATPTIYEARGEFQLNVETVRLAGLGALYERFARLKHMVSSANGYHGGRCGFRYGERWLLPAVRGEKHEAYAITEEFAGSDVSDLRAGARRDGDDAHGAGIDRAHVAPRSVGRAGR